MKSLALLIWTIVPKNPLAKSSVLTHSLHIRSKIPLHSLPSVVDNADNSNMLYTWANTEYKPDSEDYYRKCNIQIVRNENTIRDITFTHAYVDEYQEQIDTSKDAFHKMKYKIDGTHVNGQWKITTTYSDVYNFEFNFKRMFTRDNKLGWAAANLTNIMESWGTLNEYTSYVTVTDTRKAWK